MYIGLWLRSVRENTYKENSRDFAKRCNISKSCLLQIERGEVIKPTKVVLNKLSKALDVDFGATVTNGEYEFKKSQKDKRFENVFGAICRDIEKSISLLNGLCNQEYYMQNDELVDKGLDAIIKSVNDKREKLKGKHALTSEEKAYMFIEEVFNKIKVEEFPPRKKEVN